MCHLLPSEQPNENKIIRRWRWRAFMASSSIIRVPMFRNLTILHTKHVESERLVMFTILARLCLAHVDDNQIVFSNDIQ
jgi:hypothetical protein